MSEASLEGGAEVTNEGEGEGVEEEAAGLGPSPPGLRVTPSNELVVMVTGLLVFSLGTMTGPSLVGWEGGREGGRVWREGVEREATGGGERACADL